MEGALRAPFKESLGGKRLLRFRSQILYLIVERPFNAIKVYRSTLGKPMVTLGKSNDTKPLFKISGLTAAWTSREFNFGLEKERREITLSSDEEGERKAHDSAIELLRERR